MPFYVKMSTGEDSSTKAWRATTYVLVLLSALVFLVQRTSWAMFDIVFEFCIFHIPALFSAAIYMKILLVPGKSPKNGK